ncbi:hypothetical protein CEXT_732161 [Caerostris extrusa]|uniref:Uncharacterized protein n=1 Tax=Caerostris extrusa TaxID=172846 RepID=A0AAV4T2S6_CAEEX|nr:hypothetical protein CEXT_732161 [Caerostris extrusa]
MMNQNSNTLRRLLHHLPPPRPLKELSDLYIYQASPGIEHCRMSEDDKTSASFRDSLEDEKEDQTLLETPPTVPAAHHMQNLFAGENVGDGSNEPSSDYFTIY